MARPLKTGMDYFPHDTDASSDEKVEALRAVHGNDGYAFFFILLERIYRTANAELSISDAETRQILSRKVAVTEQKFDEMLQTALRWGCFDETAYSDKGVLTSLGIKRRAAAISEKRSKMRVRYTEERGISAAETREETREGNPPETGVSAEFHFTREQSKEKKSIKTSTSPLDKPVPTEPPAKAKRVARTYAEDSAEYRLADRLRSRILENLPTARVPKDLNKWADEVRRLIELDHKAPGQIAKVIDFCQRDTFWQSNILSGKSLREQYDRLVLKMTGGKQISRNDTGPDFDATEAYIKASLARQEAAPSAENTR